MPRAQRYTPTQVAEALLASRGIYTATAQRLGCDAKTVERYIARYVQCADAAKEARRGIVDLAEAKLINKLNAGEWPAIHYTLSTLGKDRGWGQSIDVRHKLEDIARQLAEETGEPYEEALAEVTNLASERRKRRTA